MTAHDPALVERLVQAAEDWLDNVDPFAGLDAYDRERCAWRLTVKHLDVLAAEGRLCEPEQPENARERLAKLRLMAAQRIHDVEVIEATERDRLAAEVERLCAALGEVVHCLAPEPGVVLAGDRVAGALWAARTALASQPGHPPRESNAEPAPSVTGDAAEVARLRAQIERERCWYEQFLDRDAYKAAMESGQRGVTGTLDEADETWTESASGVTSGPQIHSQSREGDKSAGQSAGNGENEPLIDPDCRDGKHSSCVGAPCECPECEHPR